MDAPRRIKIRNGYINEPMPYATGGGETLSYILATHEALASSPEVAKLVADAEARANKAHEKEIAVWSENYAALEREREATTSLVTRAHKVLVNLDRISVDPVLDPLIDEMAALIFRAMQPRPSEYEAAAIRRAAEETGT